MTQQSREPKTLGIMYHDGRAVALGICLASESAATFDHVTTLRVHQPLARHALNLKSPSLHRPASIAPCHLKIGYRYPDRPLAISSCQANSVRDASPVEPSLGTTHRRTRSLLI